MSDGYYSTCSVCGKQLEIGDRFYLLSGVQMVEDFDTVNEEKFMILCHDCITVPKGKWVVMKEE